MRSKTASKTIDRLITEGQSDVMQVDLTRCGGFTGAMKIASLAASHNRPVANHGFTTYINVAAALHWLNSVPNALIVEFAAQNNTDSKKRTDPAGNPGERWLSGHADEPGLGIDLNERYDCETSRGLARVSRLIPGVK